jgi:hypothetical protein
VLCSIIILENPQVGWVEYLYPSGGGHLMIIYTEARYRDEMLDHLNASCREVGNGFRATTNSFEGSADDLVYAIKKVYVPDWAREYGAEWASKVAVISDADKAFERVLKDIRENGVPSMLVRVPPSKATPPGAEQ